MYIKAWGLCYRSRKPSGTRQWAMRKLVFSAATVHQTVKVDTQSAYLGTVNQSNLIKSVGRMSNKKGPRAPVELSAEELESHRDHPKLVTLLLEQSRLTTTLRAECRSVSRNPSTRAISGVPQAQWSNQ